MGAAHVFLFYSEIRFRNGLFIRLDMLYLLKNEQLVPLPQNVSWKANINLENPIVPNSWIKAYKKLWKAYSMRCMNTDFNQVVADTLPSKISNVPGKESNGESRLICFQAFSLEFFSIFWFNVWIVEKHVVW